MELSGYEGEVFMKKRGSFLIPALVLLFLCFGCASGARSGAVGGGGPASPPASSAAAMADETQANGVQKSDAEHASGAAKPAAEKQTAAAAPNTADAGRKIVRTAEMTVETEHYDKSASDFQTAVAKFGGYIESSNIQGSGVNAGDTKRTATYTVRVPAEKLDAFLDSAGAVGSVTAKSIRGQDITQSYTDSDARLKALKEERDRILELMNKAAKIDDVITIEQRLTDVQNEIEQLTAHLKNWDSLVALSTVTVTIQEVEAVQPPAQKGFGNQVGALFTASVDALGKTFRYLFLGIVAVLPFAAVIAVIIAAVLLIRKRTKKDKNTPPEKSSEDDKKSE